MHGEMMGACGEVGWRQVSSVPFLGVEVGG